MERGGSLMIRAFISALCCSSIVYATAFAYPFTVYRAPQSSPNIYASTEQNTSDAQEPWITVFVHGMLNVAPHINFKNVCLLMQDSISDTVYAHTVRHMRQDPFFYLNEAMGPIGWQKLDPSNLNKGLASNAIAHIYNEMLKIAHLPYKNNVYYTYGWSGLMSLRQRYEEAEDLLVGIHRLVEKYTQGKGITPKVRVIGYSHGGNVALNMARIHAEKYPDMDIHIAELILMGMPVQIETDIFTESPIFEKIYHFYSRLDRIQRLDLFSVNRIFSARRFENRRTFKVPTKLTQVQVKFSRLRKNKTRSSALCTHACNPQISNYRSGQRRCLRDASPGHIELWFFKWTTGGYREDFPIAPLPVITLVPYMISELQKIEDCLADPNPIIFDMRPELGISVIKQYKDTHFATTVPFVSDEDLEPLKNLVDSIKPDNYTKRNYTNRIKAAIEQACTDYTVKKESLQRPKKLHRRKRRINRNQLRRSSVDTLASV
jgi:hypothetical protein